MHFAGDDPLFSGLTEVLAAHPFAADRCPARHGPLDGAISRFAQLLPLSFVAFWIGAEGPSMEATRLLDPDLADLALTIAGNGTLSSVKEAGGSTLDALDHLWSQIA